MKTYLKTHCKLLIIVLIATILLGLHFFYPRKASWGELSVGTYHIDYPNRKRTVYAHLWFGTYDFIGHIEYRA